MGTHAASPTDAPGHPLPSTPAPQPLFPLYPPPPKLPPSRCRMFGVGMEDLVQGGTFQGQKPRAVPQGKVASDA